MSEAKDDLERALRRKELSDEDVSKSKDALALAQKGYNDAKSALDSASIALAVAQ